MAVFIFHYASQNAFKLDLAMFHVKQSIWYCGMKNECLWNHLKDKTIEELFHQWAWAYSKNFVQSRNPLRGDFWRSCLQTRLDNRQ